MLESFFLYFILIFQAEHYMYITALKLMKTVWFIFACTPTIPYDFQYTLFMHLVWIAGILFLHPPLWCSQPRAISIGPCENEDIFFHFIALRCMMLLHFGRHLLHGQWDILN